MEKSNSHSFVYFTFPISLLPILLVDPVDFVDKVVLYSLCKLAEERYHGLNDIDAFTKASDLLGLTYPGGIQRDQVEEAREIYAEHRECRVTTSIRQEILLSYQDEEKTEDEIWQLLAVAALRSIIGKKEIGTTNNLFMWSRMAGYEKCVTSEDDLPPLIKAKANRYQRTKLLKALEDGWYLKFYASNMKGWDFSFNRNVTYEKLAERRMEKQKKWKDEELKLKKREAREQVMQRLNQKAGKLSEPTGSMQSNRGTKPVNEIVTQLKADPEYLKVTADAIRKPGLTWQPIWLHSMLDKFEAHLLSIDQKQKDPSDFKKHFREWLKYQPQPTPINNEIY